MGAVDSYSYELHVESFLQTGAWPFVSAAHWVVVPEQYLSLGGEAAGPGLELRSSAVQIPVDLSDGVVKDLVKPESHVIWSSQTRS